MSYRLRSDNTVLATEVDGKLVVYRLRQASTDSGAMEAARVLTPTSPATWGTDTTVYYNSTISDMLRGNPPKTSHGFLGFLAGLSIGGMALGGPAGWIGGALLGTALGHVVRTGRRDVHMTPVIQVGG